MFASGLSVLFGLEIILVAAAMALNRVTVAWFALRAPAGATYFPSWIEIGIVVAAVCAGILFYSLGVRYVPELDAGIVEKAHGED